MERNLHKLRYNLFSNPIYFVLFVLIVKSPPVDSYTKLLISANCEYDESKGNDSSNFCPGYSEAVATPYIGTKESKLYALAEVFCSHCKADDQVCLQLFCKPDILIVSVTMAAMTSFCDNIQNTFPACYSEFCSNSVVKRAALPVAGSLGTSYKCIASFDWSYVAGMDQWCESNCQSGNDPITCPETYCYCPEPEGTTASVNSLNDGCTEWTASTIWSGVPGMNEWCQNTCSGGGDCSTSHCQCADPTTTSTSTTVSTTTTKPSTTMSSTSTPSTSSTTTIPSTSSTTTTPSTSSTTTTPSTSSTTTTPSTSSTTTPSTSSTTTTPSTSSTTTTPSTSSTTTTPSTSSTTTSPSTSSTTTTPSTSSTTTTPSTSSTTSTPSTTSTTSTPFTSSTTTTPSTTSTTSTPSTTSTTSTPSTTSTSTPSTTSITAPSTSSTSSTTSTTTVTSATSTTSSPSTTTGGTTSPSTTVPSTNITDDASQNVVRQIVCDHAKTLDQNLLEDRYCVQQNSAILSGYSPGIMDQILGFAPKIMCALTNTGGRSDTCPNMFCGETPLAQQLIRSSLCTVCQDLSHVLDSTCATAYCS